MRYITGLSEEELSSLRLGYKKGKSSQYRSRCHCILLSSEGYQVKELASIFEVRTRTIYSWFKRYETSGISGLANKARGGCKPILEVSNELRTKVEYHLSSNPQNLSVLKSKLEEDLGKSFSKSTLRRFLKSLDTVGNGSERV